MLRPEHRSYSMADNDKAVGDKAAVATPPATPDADKQEALIEVGGQKMTAAALAQSYTELRKTYTQTAQEKSELEKKVAEASTKTDAAKEIADRIAVAIKGAEPQPKAPDEVTELLNDEMKLATAMREDAVGTVRKLIAGTKGSLQNEFKAELAKINEERKNEKLALGQAAAKKQEEDFISSLRATATKFPDVGSSPALLNQVAVLAQSDKPSQILGGKSGNAMTTDEIAEAVLAHEDRLADERRTRRIKAEDDRRKKEILTFGPGDTPLPQEAELNAIDDSTPEGARKKQQLINDIAKQRAQAGIR
jgi:hypothetical protein